jgi:aspartate-semialdehyde dehydrogenase
MKQVDVIVGGATGLVGRKMMQVLEERKFPVGRLLPLASARSAGSRVDFAGKSWAVEVLSEESLRKAAAPIALFSAGASVSRQFAPVAASFGTLVIDNSSAFRMDPDTPLVVPEVNAEAIFANRGIIANPNCSTIQMVVVLHPLHQKYHIRRVVVSTYQSVTGAGKAGYDQLQRELAGGTGGVKKFPHPIAMNCLPHIDTFDPEGYTKEERKMMAETQKIMGDAGIRVTATCVRVPVVGGHSEAVNIEFDSPFELEEVRKILSATPGVIVMDEPGDNRYPMPITSHERDEVFVGRIRRDSSVANGLNLWIVADNLRKGAATNAVQIAEEWLKRQ